MRGTIAGTLRRRPLPPTGMTVTTPRITTGTSTAVQASENAAVSETDIVEALISSPVGTVAGQQDFSQQVWDRAAVDGMGGGEFDTVLAADLGASLAASLEAQIVYGTGTAPELRGLVNAVGATSVTKTQASPTAATNFKAIGDLVRQAAEFYGTIEGLVIVMHRGATPSSSQPSATPPSGPRRSWWPVGCERTSGLAPTRMRSTSCRPMRWC